MGADLPSSVEEGKAEARERRSRDELSLGRGGAVQENYSLGQHHPGASRHPSSDEEGRFRLQAE